MLKIYDPFDSLKTDRKILQYWQHQSDKWKGFYLEHSFWFHAHNVWCLLLSLILSILWRLPNTVENAPHYGILKYSLALPLCVEKTGALCNNLTLLWQLAVQSSFTNNQRTPQQILQLVVGIVLFSGASSSTTLQTMQYCWVAHCFALVAWLVEYTATIYFPSDCFCFCCCCYCYCWLWRIEREFQI